MILKVVDILGDNSINEDDEIEAVLLRRCGTSHNDFWLSHDADEYPMLSIVVKGEVAALDFLLASDKPSFISIGNIQGYDSSESTVFPISRHRADDLEIKNDSLVPFSLALEAAKEFFTTKEKPTCVDWFEL